MIFFFINAFSFIANGSRRIDPVVKLLKNFAKLKSFPQSTKLKSLQSNTSNNKEIYINTSEFTQIENNIIPPPLHFHVKGWTLLVVVGIEMIAWKNWLDALGCTDNTESQPPK